MALPTQNLNPSAAAKTAMNTAMTHLNNYMVGTPTVPGMLVRFIQASTSRKETILAHNPIFA